MICKKVIFLLLLLVPICGCKKDKSFNYSNSLIGKWSWFLTCTGTGNTFCWSTNATNPPHNICFTPDSVYQLFYNDTLKHSEIFHTYKSVSEDGKFTTNHIKYDSGVQEVYSITNDTLILINSEGILTTNSRFTRIR